MDDTNKQEEELLDYLNGELDPFKEQELIRRLAQERDSRLLFEELQELREEVRLLEEMEAPSQQMRRRFQRQLSEWQKEDIRPRRHRLYAALSVAASLLLLIGAFIGWEMRTGVSEEQEALTAELKATRALMLELMERPEATSRMKATTVALALQTPDREIISNLSYMLNRDESTNVRLAALDALVEHGSHNLVTEALIEALQSTQPVVVQLALIQALIDLGASDAVPYLDQWIQDENIIRNVKDEARFARFKLT